jgi:hypothetical protein
MFMRKNIMLLALGMSIASSIMANAGTWSKEGNNWYYINEANAKV